MTEKRKFFDVPVDNLVEFANLVEESAMEALIVGTSDDNEIKLAVEYERAQSAEVLDLIEYVENLYED